MKRLLMGNEAIAMAALQAGVNLVSGYPGTPSTEILETVAKYSGERVHVEWSVNEKAALEIAAGAAYAGARSMVTMKQVGLNVASDPLMSLAYIGVKGGMVVVVADDPGPLSSQTEQDTRMFAQFAKIPIFDPSSPEEAFAMTIAAFAYSEKYETPVLLRPTTRVCHAYAPILLNDNPNAHNPSGFSKDAGKWVIFPRLANLRHTEIEARNQKISHTPSQKWNTMKKGGKFGLAASGIAYAYLMDALQEDSPFSLLKIGAPHPFPHAFALDFLRQVDEVLVIEELDPIIERELLMLCGKHQLNVNIRGKLTGELPFAGEYSIELVAKAINAYGRRLDLSDELVHLPVASPTSEALHLPVRPPVLCAGCPHRASFYAVKQAVNGEKVIFTGDIGCYTLGNAAPLEMVDTCLCMGADVTIAQGLAWVQPDTRPFAFIGDSTFFASGLTGVVNAVYNQASFVLVILDNATTAMTGNQPHPGTGKLINGNEGQTMRIEPILRGMGITQIYQANPFDQPKAIECAKRAYADTGLSVILYQAPCIVSAPQNNCCEVNNASCVGCMRCIKELGCPALSMHDRIAEIENNLCNGCGLCMQICPVSAISMKGGK